MERKKNSVNYYILIVILLMLFSKILGLGRDTFIGSTFGMGDLTDVYFVSIALTSSLFLGLGSGVATTLVPIVVKYRDKEESPLFKILVSLFILIVFVTLIYYAISPVVVRMYASEFNSSKIELTLSLMKIMLPSIIFVVLTYFFVAVLQGNDIFILPASISIPYNILFFLYLIFYKSGSTVYGLAIVTTIGWVLQMFVVFFRGIGFVHLKNMKYDLKKFYLPLVPIVIVALTHQLNLLIDNNQATIFGEGGVTSIYYGNILFKALVTAMVYGITAVMFPKFAEKLLEAKREGLNKSVVQVLRGMSILLIPMSVGLILLGKDFIDFIFQHGKFASSDKTMTIIAFVVYVSFMLAFGFIEVLNKAYYTLENRRIPIFITIVITSLNLLFSFAVFKFVAIPLSTALAYFIGAIVSSAIFLRGDLVGIKRLLITIIKACFSSALMALAIHYFLEWSGYVEIKAIIFSTFIGVLVYGVSIILLRERLVINMFKSAFRTLKSKFSQ